jgi:predicted RNA-binding protein with PUA-like domain
LGSSLKGVLACALQLKPNEPRLAAGVATIPSIRYKIHMAKNHWLVKQEPEAYSWSDFLKDGKTAWTGVRNFQARNNLRAMKTGDWVLFYHSVSEKRVVGLARVEKEAHPDPTAKEGDWVCVDLVPVKALKKPVSLEVIKTDKVLKNIPLVRQSRLSVTSLSEGEFDRLLALSETLGS